MSHKALNEEFPGTGTNNNGKDYMLRAIFTVPWSIKHPCCILFSTNRGRRLGASSRFKTINKLDPLHYYGTEN